ncbi:hypothetical protein LIN78_01850 [Leeia sp. TBRC 13508]|uniref:DUF1214 domain-containing protein n=1 Tax=Leeia speluncae TaxID=2884804 RepID=A0ABS8D3Q3_9NEIS|nr:hypothetical protein [Leeia speluncae]MCB6182298.1 hypothetical protein [Leeia speluncae]
MKWLLLTTVGIVLSIIQIITSPLLALWPSKLPQSLSWFQTVDYDLMGDGGHYARWADKPAYLQRLAWLLRNPTDGWDYQNASVVTDLTLVHWSGDSQTSNRPGHSGWCKARLPSGEWMLYVIYRWPGTSKCLRIYLGWKLMGAVHGSTGRYPLVCVPNPYSSYEVK